MDTRIPQKLKVYHTQIEKFIKSSITYMLNLLNQDENREGFKSIDQN